MLNIPCPSRCAGFLIKEQGTFLQYFSLVAPTISSPRLRDGGSTHTPTARTLHPPELLTQTYTPTPTTAISTAHHRPPPPPPAPLFLYSHYHPRGQTPPAPPSRCRRSRSAAPGCRAARPCRGRRGRCHDGMVWCVGLRGVLCPPVNQSIRRASISMHIGKQSKAITQASTHLPRNSRARSTASCASITSQKPSHARRRKTSCLSSCRSY